MAVHEACVHDRRTGTEAHCRTCPELWPCRIWLLAENDRLGTELADVSTRAADKTRKLTEATAALSLLEEELAVVRFGLTDAGHAATEARDG